MSTPFQEEPLQVNLFPLKVNPEAARVFRFRPSNPEKALAFLRATGWYALQKDTEVWVYGLEAPEVHAPFVAEEPVKDLRERVLALNSHLSQKLRTKGFVRVESGWLDLEAYRVAEGQVAQGPWAGRSFALVTHPAYRLEVVRLEGGFFALVDLEHRVRSQEGWGALPEGLVAYFQALASPHNLRALDPKARRTFPLDHAPATAWLLLPPSVQAALEAQAAQGTGTRRLSLDAFAANQFRFDRLLEAVAAFADFLDPTPLALPSPLPVVAQGGLRMARGTATEAKEVEALGFLEPKRVQVLLALPDGETLEVRQRPSGQTSEHLRVKERGREERRQGGSTFTRETRRLSARELLLYHFVEQERLRSKAPHVVEALAGVPSLRETWARWGLDLELVLPPVRYTRSGKVGEGEPKKADLAVILAPEDLGEAEVKWIRGLLKPWAWTQVVNPSTLTEKPKAKSFAYDLAVRAGALPFRLEGFTRHVLGLHQGREGFAWRLVDPGGQPLGQGQGLPEEEHLPPDTLVHYLGGEKGLEEVLGWTGKPVVWLQESRLRFSQKALPLGSYFPFLPEAAYLHTHPGNPGWPRALRVEVVQGDLSLEEALAQVYWLTKPAGGLYRPGKFPLSVVEKTPWSWGLRKDGIALNPEKEGAE